MQSTHVFVADIKLRGLLYSFNVEGNYHPDRLMDVGKRFTSSIALAPTGVTSFFVLDDKQNNSSSLVAFGHKCFRIEPLKFSTLLQLSGIRFPLLKCPNLLLCSLGRKCASDNALYTSTQSERMVWPPARHYVTEIRWLTSLTSYYNPSLILSLQKTFRSFTII